MNVNNDPVCALTCAINALTEQRRIEFEWTRSHHGFATKQDLDKMEKRLTDAIVKRSAITPAIESAAMRVQSTLDKLDASIPDET